MSGRFSLKKGALSTAAFCAVAFMAPGQAFAFVCGEAQTSTNPLGPAYPVQILTKNPDNTIEPFAGNGSPITGAYSSYEYLVNFGTPENAALVVDWSNYNAGGAGGSSISNVSNDAGNNVACGNSNTVAGSGTINSSAVGSNNTIASDDPNLNLSGAQAFGYNNTITADGGVALGNNNQVTSVNSMALGNGAIAGAANVGPYSVFGGKVQGPTGADVPVLALGGGGMQIQNVAPGTVTATSTDAVNGSQLFEVAQGVNAVGAGAAAGLGGGAAWDPLTGTWTAPSYSVAGAATPFDNVGDALGAIDARVTNINNAGTKYYQASSVLDGAIASGAESLAMGGKAVASAENAIAIGTGAQANTANSIALGAGSVANDPHVGAYTINGGKAAAETTSKTAVLSVGDVGAERQIQNVAAGVVSATSTDAVNGSQLYAVGTALNTAASGAASGLGAGAKWDAANGKWIAPSYDVNGQTYDNVGDALGSLAEQGTKYYQANSTGAGSVAGGQDSLAMGPDARTADGATNGVAIGNGARANSANSVALGSGAVAGDAHIGTYSVTGGSVSGAITEQNPRGGVVSVGSAGAERQIQHVAAGVVSANSTDAVNGSQLYDVASAGNATGYTTAAALGGGSTYTPGAGVSAPNYAIQGQNYNNVGDALGALNGSVNSLQGQVNNLTAGFIGQQMAIGALNRSVQRGYEGTAVALATAGGNFLQENQKYSLTGKFGSFRGQYGFGMVAQARLSQNVVAHAGVGGGVRYGGVGAFGGLTVGW